MVKATNIRFTAFGFFLSIAGCSGSVQEFPKLNIVNGSVVLSDPRVNVDTVDHSIVQFHPASGGSRGQKIWGPLHEGAYSLVTEEDGGKIPGAPEGDYMITIVPPRPDCTGIPAKYRDPKTTDLKAHVEEGFNELAFELKP